MKRFGEWIVKLRIPIILISILLLVPSALGILHTRINYDILSYLPSDLETMQGQDILMEEFGKGAYSIFVCDGMPQKDCAKLKKELEQIDHVDSVLWYDSVMDISIPVEIMPEEIRTIFYDKDNDSTLMFIFMDTTTSADETLEAVEEIRAVAGEQCFLSSMSCIVEDTKLLIQKEMPWYVVIAAVLTALILSITLDSFLVPVLILLNIGMSILYNLGSNVIQGQISFLTMALVAVLQLGVTMDYSIFLYSSFKEHKEFCSDRKDAMAEAIAATIVSITGSSLTTIAGFIALCFMSFTLGLDLGIVMAKGVIFGVISCVTVLPSFILVCDSLIEKTSHRSLNLNLDGIAGFILKHYRLMVLLMVLLWIPAIYGNDHYDVYYKLDTSLPADMGSVQANEQLKKFDMATISMVLVDSNLDHKETIQMTKEIKALDGINFAIGLDSVIGTMLPDALIPEDAKEMLQSDQHKLLLVSSAYEIATDEVNEQCEQLSNIVKRYDPNGMLIGETACTKDLIKVTDHDFAVVSAVSIGAIFVLIFLVLKSISLPVILVLVIELAIYINMGMSYYLGQTLPFIASVCVGTIQLGATVDYAILMTTRYKTERMAGCRKAEAAKIALTTSIHSIITSALGFFAATAGVGLYSSADMVGSICTLLGRGALISMVIVILMLPSMYMLFDGLICRSTIGMKKCVNK